MMRRYRAAKAPLVERTLAARGGFDQGGDAEFAN
jgi:hypothetical protein